MNTPDLFLAVDIGTTNVKTAIFDDQGDLQYLDHRICSENTIDGANEIDPDKVWQAFMEMFSLLPRGLKSNLKSMCITGQGPTILPVNEAGKPTYRAVTWLDRRGNEKIPSLLSKGYDPQIASVIAKLGWLQQLVADRSFLLQPADYLAFKLTGKIINMSFPIAGYLPWNQKWLEDTEFDRTFQVPELSLTGTVIDRINPKIAMEVGVSASMVVVSGAPDFVAELVGTGTLEDGFLCDRGGTSQGVTLCTAREVFPEGLMTTPFFLPDLWKISGIMNTTGKAIEWFCQKVVHRDLQILLQEVKNIQRPTKLVFLPYLNGERSPCWDAHAKGIFWGLDLDTDTEKMSVAILESIGYAILDVIQRMEVEGCLIHKVRTTGGQTLTPLWNQIKADIIGKNIELPKVQESGLLGCAIFSMSALSGIDIQTISRKIVKIQQVFIPDMQKHDEYARLVQIYKHLYTRNKDLFAMLSE